MNKTFKIVFNKARGALMVANELTGSVQKKGTKTVVAATLVALGLLTSAEGFAAYVDKSDAAIKNITADGSNISGHAFGVRASNNGSATVTGSNINISATAYAVNIAYGGTIQIGNDDTDTVTIYSKYDTISNYGSPTSEKDAKGNVLGFESSELNQYRGGTIDIRANKSIDISTGMSGTVAAIWVQNCTENPIAPKIHSTVNLTAESIHLRGERGIAAYSNSEVNISGNTTIDASYAALDLRGNSTVNINTDGKHSTVLNGDIVFETPNTPEDAQNSGKLINSNVTVVLSGSDSSWTGRSYQEYEVDGKLQQLIGLKGDPSYHGNVTGFKLTAANGATWNVTGDSFVNELTLKNGGAIQVADDVTVRVGSWDGTQTVKDYISVEGTGNTLALGTGATLDSKLKIASGAELITNLNTAFTGASVSNETLTLLDSVANRLSFVDSEGGTLSISDKFTYTGTDLTKLSHVYADQVGLKLVNATLALDDDNTTISTDVTTGAISGGKSIGIVPGKSLTISGNGKTSSIGTLTLASMDSLSAAFVANNNTTVNVDTLSGTGKVSVGEHNGTNAHMSINKLGMAGGSIFVDPYYGYGESTLAVASLSDGVLNTNVTAGTGALVTFVTDVASAKNAVAKLDGFSALQSVVYVGTSMTLGASGSIVIKPLATAADETLAKKVYVASNSGLVIDQSAVGSNTVFAGAEKVTFEGGSKLGITNATVGTITLTDAARTVVNGITTATTDNPFVEATVDGNTVVNTMSAEGGLGALASTGIQAMTRRSDTVLAQTIADRTSVDQELAAGTNLWVDVTGERYEADKLDNGGEFKSDMGYGAFGADFAVTQDITAGAAFQYGKGSLRSGVSSIKNSIDSYGVTAYGAMKFGDAKVVAEASYIKNENDITSSQTALNQSVDSEIYSVGVRGQHRFTAGNFQFVPSVGVRVSRLNTDAMQVGAVNIKKQEQTLVQVPIALRVNGFEQNVSGWSVAPSFKVAYVPTFGDKEISVFGADQTVIDTSPVQGDFGIRAQNGNLMVNANMMLGGGKDGTSSVGGKVGLKYVF